MCSSDLKVFVSTSSVRIAEIDTSKARFIFNVRFDPTSASNSLCLSYFRFDETHLSFQRVALKKT